MPIWDFFLTKNYDYLYLHYFTSKLKQKILVFVLLLWVGIVGPGRAYRAWGKSCGVITGIRKKSQPDIVVILLSPNRRTPETSG
jgi:hypothetical protein